ncbi:hypothetical protein ASAP_1418 [Asaia bogorensis]|uniref:Uncharacterized protein n=1 Tax=Asaia bogorensis TaxID=91915 RepID=A0A060QFJ3_9PROT|nr:hypothetical protein ASAP_1418 [Asaia bogorensis]
MLQLREAEYAAIVEPGVFLQRLLPHCVDAHLKRGIDQRLGLVAGYLNVR